MYDGESLPKSRGFGREEGQVFRSLGSRLAGQGMAGYLTCGEEGGPRRKSLTGRGTRVVHADSAGVRLCPLRGRKSPLVAAAENSDGVGHAMQVPASIWTPPSTVQGFPPAV
jgi:hypothetical protein